MPKTIQEHHFWTLRTNHPFSDIFPITSCGDIFLSLSSNFYGGEDFFSVFGAWSAGKLVLTSKCHQVWRILEAAVNLRQHLAFNSFTQQMGYNRYTLVWSEHLFGLGEMVLSTKEAVPYFRKTAMEFQPKHLQHHTNSQTTKRPHWEVGHVQLKSLGGSSHDGRKWLGSPPFISHG